MKINRTPLKSLLFSFLLATSLTGLLASPALAARSCRVAVSSTAASGVVELTKVKGSDKLILKGEKLERVKALFDQQGLELYAKKIPEVIEAMSEQLRAGSDEPSMTKSEKLAKFCEKLNAIVKTGYTADQNLMIGYYMGEAVLKMERLTLKKFKKTNTPDVFSKPGALHIKDFHRYVESYIDNTALYKNLSDEIGFINWDDIRHLYSNNSWGIGLRDHDMYHLHYAYGHPYYLALNFMSARGINDRRYAMMSALWEAVDNNQTTFESKMSNYFKEKRMSPQEGMIYLARATNAMLDEVEGLTGNATNTNSYYYNQSAMDVSRSNNIGLASGWQPHLVKFGRSSAPDNISVYDTEIENFINKSIAKKAIPANKRYYNYHRKGPGKTSNTDDDTSH